MPWNTLKDGGFPCNPKDSGSNPDDYPPDKDAGSMTNIRNEAIRLSAGSKGVNSLYQAIKFGEKEKQI